LKALITRITPLVDVDTGVAGRLTDKACTCGTRESLILVD
jgi:hypothetical protein